MQLTHHYSVTRAGGEPYLRRFHTFAEAEACFSELATSSASEGLEEVGQSYWRKHYRAPGGAEVTLALDDEGLAPCDPAHEG